MGEYIVVHDSENDAWCVCLADAIFSYDYYFGTYTEEQAKAAAEAECDRLNEEHRKEQK